MRNSYISLSQKLTSNIYILSIREAFIALIPYLIISSAITLLSALLKIFTTASTYLFDIIFTIDAHIYSLFPLLTLISITYFLAKNFHISRIPCIALSLIGFIALGNNILIHDPNQAHYIGQLSFNPSAIILPFATIIIMKSLLKFKPLQIIQSTSISAHLRHHINLIIPFSLTLTTILLLSYILSPAAAFIFSPMLELLTNSSVYMQTEVRIFFTHLFWFFGIHGDNTYNLLVDSLFLMHKVAPNIHIGDLINFFVLTGGSGSGWSLIIAILLFSKDSHSRQISKLSLPFAFFNINELMIFGLPIVFNPYLIIPFIAVPITTVTCSLFAANLGIIEFIPHSMSWITPPIINTFIASNGDISTIFFQICMIALGVFIYAPFIKISHLYNDDREIAETLATKLSIGDISSNTITDDTQPKQQTAANNSNLIEDILTGDLLLRYNPIVNGHDNKITEFSAQLLLLRSDGKIISLDSLETLDRTNICIVIYTWTLNRLEQDFELWQAQNFSPKIHLYLDSKMLQQNDLIDRIITAQKNKKINICIEINEKSIKSKIKSINNNLNNLKKNSFEICLIEFSSKHTYMDTLLFQEIDNIIFDKEFFTDSSHNRISEALLYQLCQLCNNMGFRSHINNINCKEDLDLAKRCDIDCMRGSYFSQALPSREAYKFCSNWNEKN